MYSALLGQHGEATPHGVMKRVVALWSSGCAATQLRRSGDTHPKDGVNVDWAHTLSARDIVENLPVAMEKGDTLECRFGAVHAVRAVVSAEVPGTCDAGIHPVRMQCKIDVQQILI